MATWNKSLHSLDMEGIERASLRYLMGWHDLMADGWGFRPKGLNAIRAKHGMEPLTKEWSMEYRVEYVKANFSDEEIYDTISSYLETARVGDTRWTGIELFGCRFGRDYAVAFKRLLGAVRYRELSERLRRDKLVETQIAVHGGVGLAGEEAKRKAMATNLLTHGGSNVMDDSTIRARLAMTNRRKYGGISPFSNNTVREKALRIKNPELWAAMSCYKKSGVLNGGLVESRYEFQVFLLLAARFGKDDVFCQYGVHPSDPRYPYNCDFYVKSQDLFIELHLHYSHGGHWYDPNNHDDALRLSHLAVHGRPRHYAVLLKTWAGADVRKRDAARQAGLRYLVFWGDGKCAKGQPVRDFDTWFYEYDCDYDSFVKDHPENTY